MIKKILITASVLIAMNSVAYGAQISQCDYDRDTGNVTISGTSDISDDNEITVNVKESGNTVYEGQTTAKDGKYVFSFKLSGNELKTYNVKVGEKSVYTASTDSFVYYGSQAADKLTLLKEYADKSDLSNFKAALAEAVPVLGIKLSTAETEQLNNIADIVMLSVKSESELTVEKLDDIVNDALFVQMIRVCNNASDLDTILTNNSARITDRYPLIWAKYTTGNEKASICNKIIDQVANAQNLTENFIADTFMVETAAYYINNAAGWENAKKFISDVKSEIGINAETLSSDSRIYINMMNATYKVKTDFNKVYTTPVSDATIPTTPTGGSTGGSGGGSIGGSGSYSPSTPGSVEPTQKFKDLENVEWAKTAIEALAKDGVIKGKSENEFAPMDNILREESAAMLVRLFNLPTPESKTGFGDVASGEWYEDCCYAVKSSGVVNGIEDGLFGVGTYITRQDFVTIIYRAMQKYGISGKANEETDVFSDAESIAEYAQEPANYLKKCGIIEGKEEGRFSPTDNITRAEAAKILYSVRNLKIEGDYVKTGGIQ